MTGGLISVPTDSSRLFLALIGGAHDLVLIPHFLSQMEKCVMSRMTKGDKGKKPSPRPPNNAWLFWARLAVKLLLYITGGGDLP